MSTISKKLEAPQVHPQKCSKVCYSLAFSVHSEEIRNPFCFGFGTLTYNVFVNLPTEVVPTGRSPPFRQDDPSKHECRGKMNQGEAGSKRFNLRFV